MDWMEFLHRDLRGFWMATCFHNFQIENKDTMMGVSQFDNGYSWGVNWVLKGYSHGNNDHKLPVRHLTYNYPSEISWNIHFFHWKCTRSRNSVGSILVVSTGEGPIVSILDCLFLFIYFLVYSTLGLVPGLSWGYNPPIIGLHEMVDWNNMSCLKHYGIWMVWDG